MYIEIKPDITEVELLEELEGMSWDEIMSVPLTGRFTGLFKNFSEMSNLVEKNEIQKRLSITGQYNIKSFIKDPKHPDTDDSYNESEVVVSPIPNRGNEWTLLEIQLIAA